VTERDPEITDKDVVIPVVAETDDSFLSDNRAFGITREDVYAAKDGPVAEGCIGAGTGLSSSTSEAELGPPRGSSSCSVNTSSLACWFRSTTVAVTSC